MIEHPDTDAQHAQPPGTPRDERLSLWPSLEQAWRVTGDASEGRAADGARWTLLQGEDRTRVLRLEAPGHRARVLKVYATPAHLAWRTLGMVSRANREFTVMMEAHRGGLPLARPSYWLEQRLFGVLRFSAIALEPVVGPDLETALSRPDVDAGERTRLARLAGDLLGRFHRAGLYWATAAPRNLLLTADADSEPLRAIDLPYATLAQRSIMGSDDALLDLACLLRMTDGAVAFDGDCRHALMLAYSDGDAAAAAAMDELVVLRSHLAWKGRRLRRRVRNLLRPGTHSAGCGGCYASPSNAYRRLEGQAVTL